jgi:hypothetical protein
MFLVGLLIVFALVGIFAADNRAIQHFTFLGTGWDVALWVPVALGVAAMGVLMLLHMIWADLGHRFVRFSLSREVGEHRGQIANMQAENERLREELAALRGEARAAAPATNAPAQGATWFDGVRQRIASR